MMSIPPKIKRRVEGPMKLTVHAFVTLDGVMQAPSTPEEDTSYGFDQGGWASSFGDDDDVDRVVSDWFKQTDELLYGRGTYDSVSTFWSHVTDPDDQIAATINAAPKHLVSSSTVEPRWENTASVFSGDIEGEVTALKERSGRELQVHGSWQLVQTLHNAGLIDEYRIIEFPVVVGPGKRLFSDNAMPYSFDVVHTELFDSGAVYRALRPAASLQ